MGETSEDVMVLELSSSDSLFIETSTTTKMNERGKQESETINSDSSSSTKPQIEMEDSTQSQSSSANKLKKTPSSTISSSSSTKHVNFKKKRLLGYTSDSPKKLSSINLEESSKSEISSSKPESLIVSSPKERKIVSPFFKKSPNFKKKPPQQHQQPEIFTFENMDQIKKPEKSPELDPLREAIVDAVTDEVIRSCTTNAPSAAADSLTAPTRNGDDEDSYNASSTSDDKVGRRTLCKSKKPTKKDKNGKPTQQSSKNGINTSDSSPPSRKRKSDKSFSSSEPRAKRNKAETSESGDSSRSTRSKSSKNILINPFTYISCPNDDCSKEFYDNTGLNRHLKSCRSKILDSPQ